MLGNQPKLSSCGMSLKTAIRPPKKPEPPKMIVETVQFNPSVCTCGEHGCQPKYRMEKRVLWSNKEVCNAKQQSKINDREKKNESRESKERITKKDRKIGSVTESKQMGLKEDNDQECPFIIEADGNKCDSAESFKERMTGEVEVRSGYKANCAIKEKVKEEVECEDDNDDEKEEVKREECVFKTEVGYSDSKDDISIDEEASNTNYIKENKSKGRSERDNSERRSTDGIYGEKSTENDPESALNNDCKWDGISSKDDQIAKDQTAGEGDRAVDRDDAGHDCSENRILLNNSNEAAESCSLESKDDGLEDVEIASAFGIISIYCNSELHSWMSFEGEDA